MDFLSNRKRREYFHPELQAELEFGVEQSVNAGELDEFLENYDIFIDNGEDWEDINKDIIEIRSEKKQKKLAGIVELEMVVELEIDYVRALWNSDFETAVGKTEDILAHLTSPDLKGYRALWEYLAGSSAYQSTKLTGFDLTIKALYGSTTYCNFYSHVKYSPLASSVRVIYVAFCCYTAPDIQPFFD